jgi:hypothetical protein
MRVPPRASTTTVVLGVLDVVTLYRPDGAAVPLTARQSLHNHAHRLRSKLTGTALRREGDR